MGQNTSFAISALGSGPKAVIALALSLAFGVVLVVLRVLMKNVDSPFVRIVCFASSAVIMAVFLVFAVLLVPAAVVCWPQPYAQLVGLPNCGPQLWDNPGYVVRNGLITVQEVKAILERKQFYRGEIDGKVDAAYHKAVAEFQKSEGIMVDGLVGAETYAKLRLQ